MHTVFRGVFNRVEEKTAKNLQDYLVFFYIFEKSTFFWKISHSSWPKQKEIYDWITWLNHFEVPQLIEYIEARLLLKCNYFLTHYQIWKFKFNTHNNVFRDVASRRTFFNEGKIELRVNSCDKRVVLWKLQSNDKDILNREIFIFSHGRWIRLRGVFLTPDYGTDLITPQ